MYLYVDQATGLDSIPDSLKKKIGATELAMTLTISADTKLAQATAEAVLFAIEEHGFYLQMPVTLIDYMQEVNKANHFLGKESM